ncbi:AbrB/MazE/SpoVT family DNA-binding domain-containing protein [Xenorhabdus griffiniae]|uniref:AbrB/MazE/SpoVT family DNA-binding domain-containing protein n=1 Tax=Xenorhabdus griffiniae TaxID=351672 RepID=UPI0023581F7B|nr:AbrB/MazE/SpoVT family DNA-binding domain-containing protein [Xenorhabdus griffiniae]MDC9607255.1 AbrB/MazE/SpoVT family DNA-binding domain-containing protein [Xenorhabdus griffiniae]
MAITRLRQQGGAVVVTIPSEVATVMGWSVGMTLDIKPSGDTISIKPVGRIARGRKSLSELLQGIDETEVQTFNEATADELNSHPVGHEVI